MAANRTAPDGASVEHHLAAIADPSRRHDCEALAASMAAATGQPPAMWGSAIVGFGRYRYRYASGRTGETCVVGFSSRKADISIYGLGGVPGGDALLSRLGRHTMGKGCLHIRSLSDIDRQVLDQLVAAAVAARADGAA